VVAMSTEPKVTVLRGQLDRRCSACGASVSSGVCVRNASPVHFLFCRRCSARIGVVGKAIGSVTTVSKKKGV
jgi:hypothetical protein